MIAIGILLILGIWVGVFLVIRGIYISACKADGQNFPMRLPKE